MPLFNADEVNLDGPMKHVMGHAEYLRRSTRHEMHNVRATLEGWFSRYPEGDKARLKADLLASSNTAHKSAFFELFLHEFLLRNGWVVQVHPEVNGTTRLPDFLCTKDNVAMYVEAKITTGASEQREAAIRRLETVFDTINKQLKSNKFFLSVVTRGFPSTPVAGKIVVEQLRRWLDSIQHTTYLSNFDGSDERTEQHTFTHDEHCQFIFDALPHEARDEDNERIIGAIIPDYLGGWAAPSEPIKTAIEEKAGAYGDLGKPYIVALNTHDTFSRIGEDTLDAVYGKEKVVFGRLGQGSVEHERARDGSFGSPEWPRKRHVSGVLAFNNVGTTALSGPQQGVYVPHLWTSYALTSPFPLVGSFAYENDEFLLTSGQPLVEIMGLPDGWPLQDGDADA